MADYGGDKEYQEKIKTLLLNVKKAPPARAIQAAGRIGDLGLPDKQLLAELTILSQETSDNLVRDAIIEAQERVRRKTILPVSDEKELTPDAIPAATQEIEPEIPPTFEVIKLAPGFTVNTAIPATPPAWLTTKVPISNVPLIRISP